MFYFKQFIKENKNFLILPQIVYYFLNPAIQREIVYFFVLWAESKTKILSIANLESITNVIACGFPNIMAYLNL